MKSILIVENDPDYLDAIERVVRFGKYDVITAENGLEGYRLAEQTLPDLIISDIMMPELTGFEMLKAIRAKPLTASIPVIFLTSLADLSTFRKSMSLGLDDFLLKSSSSQEILTAINVRLQRAGQSHAEARERLRRQRDLLSLIAHDLRGPLTTIYCSLDSLHLSGLEGILPVTKRIENASDLINTMVDRLTLIGKNPEMDIPLKRETVCLRDLCSRAIDSVYHDQTDQHSIVLECESEERVELDPFLVGQILSNLLSNALKYSPQGGNIRVRASRNESVVCFEVSDEGMGIPAKDLPYLFNRYFRSELSQKIRGLGLGLNGVKLLAEKQGGTVRCESREGIGSRFLVEIPLVKVGK